ncbi:hypothetical protein EBZ80_27075 [bacterium]|nr:hypothetical protein [bacterium]
MIFLLLLFIQFLVLQMNHQIGLVLTFPMFLVTELLAITMNFYLHLLVLVMSVLKEPREQLVLKAYKEH